MLELRVYVTHSLTIVYLEVISKINVIFSQGKHSYTKKPPRNTANKYVITLGKYEQCCL